MVTWFYSFMVLYSSIVLWFSSSMVTWFYVSMILCFYSIVIWLYDL
jgi:hypothetical protein